MKRLCYIFLAVALLYGFGNTVRGQDNGEEVPNKFRVFLDAGHGGYDPGASGLTAREKNITLSIVLLVGEIIKSEHTGIEPFYSRMADHFVQLHRRAAMANDSGADLFISVHCNSNPNKGFRGAETYVMGLHKSAENLEVAKTENAVILAEDNYFHQYEGFDPDSDESYILMNMIQTANINQSIDFARTVQNSLQSVAGLKNRGVMQAGFVVLYLTGIPGVLIEVGFLSNEQEEQFLLDPLNQQKIARAIVDAIVTYKEKQEALEPELVLKLSSEDQVDINMSSPERIYRIWFYTFNKPLKDHDHRFEDLPELWYFADENGIHYTFEKSNSLDDIELKLANIRESGVLQRRYSRSVKIVEIEDDKIISVIDPED